MLPTLLLAACLDPATDGAGAPPATDDTGTDLDGGAPTDGGGSRDGGTSGTTPGPDDTGPGDTGPDDAGTPDGGTPDGGTTDGGATTTFLDYREPGPYAVETSSGTLATTSGCGLSWTRYTASGGPVAPLVLLSHGLQRTGEQMSSWAEHLASWGLDVVAPDLCNSNAWDLDQEQNGRDLVELADSLGAGPVLYAGHSAGGLASIVATAADPEAVALLGLDPTEWDGIGAAVIDGIGVPVGLMVGDPGICNLYNNALELFAEVEAVQAVRITEADHCDFEEPTDWVCTAACGESSNDLFTDEQIGQTVISLATAFLAWQAGVDPEGRGWWAAGGEGYDLLLAEGAIGAP